MYKNIYLSLEAYHRFGRKLDYARRGEEEVSNLSDLASWIAKTVGYESRQIEMCVVKVGEKKMSLEIFRTIPPAKHECILVYGWKNHGWPIVVVVMLVRAPIVRPRTHNA